MSAGLRMSSVCHQPSNTDLTDGERNGGGGEQQNTQPRGMACSLGVGGPRFLFNPCRRATWALGQLLGLLGAVA